MKEKEKKFKVFVPIRHPVGGIRTYLKYTIKNLPIEKYYFHILGPKIKTFEQLCQDLEQLNVKFTYFNRNSGLCAIWVKIVRLLIKEKYDIIHSQGFTAGILTVLANFITKIPHIMTSHDVLRSDQFDRRYSVVKKKVLEYLMKKLDIIQSVSYDAQANLLEYLPSLKRNKEKLIVVHNGIDIEEFCVSSNFTENTIIERQDKDLIIGFIGRYTKQKGFFYVMETAQILKNTFNYSRFKIICVGWMNIHSREYNRQIIEMGLTEHFSFMGFLPNVSQIMREIEVLIIPSLWEACPILPMEALVSGTPIIAFSCIGLREVLENTPAKLVNIGDTKKIANELLYLSKNKEKVKQEYLLYKNRAIKRFDALNTSKKLHEIYQRLL